MRDSSNYNYGNLETEIKNLSIEVEELVEKLRIISPLQAEMVILQEKIDNFNYLANLNKSDITNTWIYEKQLEVEMSKCNRAEDKLMRVRNLVEDGRFTTLKQMVKSGKI
jgi:hypothetical protein